MSVALISMCKDEADVAEPFVRYYAGQVDEIIVSDNASTDGTTKILNGLIGEAPLMLLNDPDPAYFQSRKMTALGQVAYQRGHNWGIFADFDEIWYVPDGRRLVDYLEGVPPDVQMVTAELFNHLPSGDDPPASCDECGNTGVLRDEAGIEVPCFTCQGLVEPNPFRRIGWRQRQHAPLGKVACRLRPDLVIHAGNHSASTSGTALAAPGLVIRHFSWRSPEQYERKLRNGARAYAATDLPESTGAHWRMFGDPDSEDFGERVRAHFHEWFYSQRPRDDASLIYDPAPLLES